MPDSHVSTRTLWVRDGAGVGWMVGGAEGVFEGAFVAVVGDGVGTLVGM